MKKSSLTKSIALIFLISFVCVKVQAQNIEYGYSAIKTESGILLVHNDKDYSLTLEVKAKEINPIESQNMMFSADGQVLQVLRVENSKFIKPNADAKTSPTDKDILQAHKIWESDYLNEVLKVDSKAKPEIKFEFVTVNGDRTALYWEYPMPASYTEVSKQLFLSTVVGQKVLIIGAPIKIGATRQDVKDIMLKLISTLKISKTPYDVNVLAEEIRKGKKP